VNTVEARILGAQPLKPEKSRNYGIGVALEPLTGLSATVDYYVIDIDDRIVLSENFTGADIQALFVAAGLRGVTGGRYFTNAIDTRTRGLDAVVNYGFNVQNLGVVRFTTGYNQNRTHVTNVIPTPSQLGNRGEALFGRVERARIEEGQPRNNFVASAGFDARRLGLSLRTQRYGEVTVRNPVGSEALDQTFGAKWISDASVTLRAVRQLSVTLGADNIFDVYPDPNDNTGNVATGAGGNSNFGIFPYSSFSPFGFNGRFIYARLSYGL
jgi:iron complex outermembrane receptor protein